MIDRPRFLVKNYMRIGGQRQTSLEKARGRLVLIGAFFALVYCLVGARVFDLTIIQGRLAQEVDQGQVDIVASADDEIFRADIKDRNGVLLATSLETASLAVDPSMVFEPVKTAKALCKIFPDMVYGDVLNKLQKKSRFVWLRRSLTPREQYAVLELGEPALRFQPGIKRIYPQGGLAVHMVGYGDVDGNGLAGIERHYNDILSDGKDSLTLTLDVRLQHILRREMQRAMKEFSGVGGAGVIMDISNGEVLAAVSLPDFDPHQPGTVDASALFNRLTLGVYELGSVFKIFSTAAFLEKINPPMDYRLDASKPLKRGNFKISDYHAENRLMTVPEVFMHSSNIGSALMAEAIGTESMKNFYSDLGLFTPLTIEIDEVGRPLLPDVWREINTLTAAYGHGIAVSPMQMVSAASSIINGGILVRPTMLLNESAVPNESAVSVPKEELRIVSPATAHRMRQLLRLVVTDGTGAKADVPGYRVGGKTGTADKKKRGGKGYDTNLRISSFLAFFPIEAPQYAVYVMIDEPKGNKSSFGYATAGWVAAPAVKRIISAMAPLLGMKPQHLRPENDISASLKEFVSFKGGAHDTY